MLGTIEMNNYNYGMTGGQVSPTTPEGGNTTTTPYGNLEEPFDLADLVIGAGAPYVARWPMGLPYETIETIKTAITRPGFSFVEVLTPCPTGASRVLSGHPPYHVQGPALHLIEYATHVLTHDTDCDQLHPGQEKHGDDEGGEARRVEAGDQSLDEIESGQPKRDNRDDQARERSHAQRHVRE